MTDNTLIAGDPLEPYGNDLIAQVTTLPVGEPVPEGWRVVTGNSTASLIARVAMRYEIKEEQKRQNRERGKKP